ncbi:MAG: GatB/YqeY domain-containing protein [Candidatus Zixiibacteriota bacterium]
MNLLEKIDQDMKQALKAGNKDKLTVLRGLKSDLRYRQIDKADELSDEDVIAVLSSSAKKRRESIEQFRKGGREDLAKKEQFELDIITSYLPKQLSEEELRRIISDAIAETGADSPQKVGQVMKIVIPKIKGQADGKLVNKLAMDMLAKKV